MISAAALLPEPERLSLVAGREQAGQRLVELLQRDRLDPVERRDPQHHLGVQSIAEYPRIAEAWSRSR